MTIPKKAFDPNTDVGVWRSDTPDGDTFILPEYVIGSMLCDDRGEPLFERNPIPVKERHNCNYRFKNETDKPISNEKETSEIR